MAPRSRRGRCWRAALGLLAAAVRVRAGARAGPCSSRFLPPSDQAPLHATKYNGVALQDTCVRHHDDRPYHIFVIGDWGSVQQNATDTPKPANQKARKFVKGIDDAAQQLVADQMRLRARDSRPDYVLNVGDNFYWGGLKAQCGFPTYQPIETGQWGAVFEEMYGGAELREPQWLSVLGNHDYGGFYFTAAWDQEIGYTWKRQPPWSGRWMLPAQYWSARVNYPDFSVDYYFVDSNVFNAYQPDSDPEHNICGWMHNIQHASCGAEGPHSVKNCPQWFQELWDTQMEWLDEGLSKSDADWQIVVTHFPPVWGPHTWESLSMRHGIDLIVTGHEHNQHVHYMEDSNFLKPTAWIVSGGGGGITSEGPPHRNGHDDQYGFMDLTISKAELKIEAISHSGLLRSTTTVRPRPRAGMPAAGHAAGRPEEPHRQKKTRESREDSRTGTRRQKKIRGNREENRTADHTRREEQAGREGHPGRNSAQNMSLAGGEHNISGSGNAGHSQNSSEDGREGRRQNSSEGDRERPHHRGGHAHRGEPGGDREARDEPRAGQQNGTNEEQDSEGGEGRGHGRGEGGGSVQAPGPGGEPEGTSMGFDMVVENLDYQRVAASRALLRGVQGAVKRAIAVEASGLVGPEHIDVSLSAGSVVVHSVITPPEDVRVPAVVAKLNASAPLARLVAERLGKLEGIGAASTGPLEVKPSGVFTVAGREPRPTPRDGDSGASREHRAGAGGRGEHLSTNQASLIWFLLMTIVVALLATAAMRLGKSIEFDRCPTGKVGTLIPAPRACTTQPMSLLAEDPFKTRMPDPRPRNDVARMVSPRGPGCGSTFLLCCGSKKHYEFHELDTHQPANTPGRY